MSRARNSLKRACVVGAFLALGAGLAALRVMDKDLSSTEPTTEADSRPGFERPEPILAPAKLSSPSDQETRAPAVACGPRGKVVEKTSGEPIGGISVQLKFGSEVLAEAVTSSDGTFQLPVPERRRRSVAIASDEWRSIPSRIRLDDDQSAGRSELAFQVERIVSAPVRGQVLDWRTGEPVPNFLLDIGGPFEGGKKVELGQDSGGGSMVAEIEPQPRRVEQASTDHEGRFLSSGGFEAGEIRINPIDHPRFRDVMGSVGSSPQMFSHTCDASNPSEAVLKVSIGPTYLLGMALPEGTVPDDFFATFSEQTGRPRDLHRMLAEDPGSPAAFFFSAIENPEALGDRAPLRDGDPIWTRFPSPGGGLLPWEWEGKDHRLFVRSRSGYWAGESVVHSVVGMYPELVPIDLQPTGAVKGIVTGPDGDPVPTAWVQVCTAATPTIAARETGVQRNGRFELDWISEGDYVFVVETDRYDEWRSAISVRPGTTVSVEARLSSGRPLGTVSGVLRSRTGQHRSKGAMVSLIAVEKPDFSLSRTAMYRKRDEGYVAPFSFEDVPSGVYDLEIQPLDNQRWEQRRMRVSPPAENLEFVCEDDLPTFDLEVRAVDSNSGKTVLQAASIIWQGDPLEDVRLDRDWQTGLYEEVPEVPLHWIVRAYGYRLASGDERSLIEAGEKRVLAPKLEPGWGQLFKVTTPKGEPVEGVELLADGNSIGKTDAQGMVSMNLAAKPSELEFRYLDWIVTWGTVDPNDPSFGSGPETPVYLAPKE